MVTDLKHDYSITRIQRADQLDSQEFDRLFGDMEERGRGELEREGSVAAEIGFLRMADMRYSGQSYELTVMLPSAAFTADTAAEAVARFHAEHHRAYGFNAEAETVEYVNLRVTVSGKLAKPRLRTLAPSVSGSEEEALVKHRQVYFAEAGGFVACPVYDRYRLGDGAKIQGPALIVEMDSITVVHPGFAANVDGFGNLWIQFAQSA